MAFDIAGFINEFFSQRIAEHGMFNLVDTLTYGAIMLAVGFFVLYPVLDRRGVKFNLQFMLALLPYILFGSAFRIIEDMRMFPRSPSPLEFGYYTGTPGIWLLVGGFTIAALFAAMFLSKKSGKDFYIIFAAIGSAACVPVLVFDFLHFVAWFEFMLIIAMVLAVTGATYLVVERIKKGFFKNDLMNTLAVGSQALDGNATFVATQVMRCGEQHPVSEMLLESTGFPAAFILVKVLLVLLIVYYVDKEIKSENLRGFIKMFIIILGAATGLRDLLTVGVGTCM